MAGDGALIGIDLGTTSVKIVASAVGDGRSLAEASQRYGLRTPGPGYVEQDPDEIYRATMRSLRTVLDEVKLRGEEPRAIGFSAAMHGLLAVDARGEPISPLINWMDRRSGAIADRWHADGTAERLYARTGAPVHPMLPLCKLRWLAELEPDLFRRAARFVGMKELFVYRWTGEWLIDESIGTATGMFDTRSRVWDQEALELAGVGPQRLSQPSPSSTRRTVTRAQVAGALGIDQRTAVVLSASDGALANLGAGAIGRETLALTLGTSGALRLVVDEPALDPQGRTFCYVFDDLHWLVGGPTSSAGAVLDWIFAIVVPEVRPEKRLENAVALAEQIAPGSEGLTMLPFLSGERAPYWRSDLRGALSGVDLAHDRRHILRSAFEGVVFGLFAVHYVIGELAGAPRAILLSGGLTHAPFVRQLIADVFEIETRLPDRQEASAFGAAMSAGLATGAIASIERVAAMIRYPQVYGPIPERSAAYREAFARYERSVATLLSTAQNPSPGANPRRQTADV